MAGALYVPSDLEVIGKIKVTTLPNATGTLVTWNSSNNTFSTRTNAQIISDLGLVTTAQLSGYIPYTGANQAINLNTQQLTTGTQFLNRTKSFSINSTHLANSNNNISGYFKINLTPSAFYGTTFNLTISGGYNSNLDFGIVQVSGTLNPSVNDANRDFVFHTVKGFTGGLNVVTRGFYIEPKQYIDENGIYYIKAWKRASHSMHIYIDGNVTVNSSDTNYEPNIEFIEDATPVTLYNKPNYLTENQGRYLSNTVPDSGYTELFSGDLNTLPNGSYVQAIGGSSTNGASGIGTPRSLISFGARNSNDSISQSDILVGTEGFAVRNRTNNIWRTAWHSGNFNPAQYVLQSSLNTQLANYVPINGVTTINNTKTFTSSPIVPNGTLAGHAINLGQANDLIEDKVENFGGVNLVQDSHFYDGTTTGWDNAYGTHVVENHIYKKTFATLNTAARIGRTFQSLKAGVYTLTFFIKTPIAISWYSFVNASPLIGTSPSSPDKFERRYVTFSVPTDGDVTVRGYVPNIPVGSVIEIDWFKLEEGYVSTDWTPTLEEQKSDYNETNSLKASFIKNKPTLPDVSSFVPYTGANQPINLNTQKIIHNGVTSNVRSITSQWLSINTPLSNTNKVAYLIIEGFVESTTRQLYIEVESVAGNGEYKRLVKGFNVNFTNSNTLGTTVESRYLEIVGYDAINRYSIGEVEKHSNTALKIPLIWSSSNAQSTNRVSVKAMVGDVSNLTFRVEYDATSTLTAENPFLYRDASEKWVNEHFVAIDKNIVSGNANNVKPFHTGSMYYLNLQNSPWSNSADVVGSISNFGGKSYGLDLASIVLGGTHLYARGYVGGTASDWFRLFHSGNLTNVSQLNNDAGYITSSNLPTVNNGQLTLSTGTGLSGSATFTANQAGGSTFSVAVASTHKLPTIAEWGNTLKKNESNTVTQNFEITNSYATMRVGDYGAIQGSVNGVSEVNIGTDDGYAITYSMEGGASFDAFVNGISGNNGGTIWSLTNGNGHSLMITPETGNTNRVLALGAKVGGITYYANNQGVIELPAYTSYTAGNGLTLSGTTFGQTITTSGSGTVVTGITQTSNGFQVNLGTPSGSTTAPMGVKYYHGEPYIDTDDYRKVIASYYNSSVIEIAFYNPTYDGVEITIETGVNNVKITSPIFARTDVHYDFELKSNSYYTFVFDLNENLWRLTAVGYY